jgi:hypothetical protein
MATRGTIPRAELRQIAAATYHQVWWPNADEVVYEGENLPVWDEAAGAYFDPATGEVLPTWDEALDALDEDPDAQPHHVCRFGTQVDAKGVLAGSEDADRCVRYLAKYLTKDIAECHAAETPAQERHADRLVEALRYEPCSPRCANWLRYGIQPDHPKAGLRPGFCRSKAHRREHLGYAGRRVLVSRKWSGKTLADHKADRLTWVLNALGVSSGNEHQDDDQGDGGQRSALPFAITGNGHAWELARPTDPDVPPREHRLLRAVGEALKRRTQLDNARRTNLSATGEHAA